MMQFRLSDGEFVRSVAMPVTADDMEVLPDGGFIFACVPTGGQRKLLPSRHRLFVTDKDLNVVRSLFQYDEGDQDPIGQRFYLTRNGSEIVFGSLMSSGFSILSGDNLSQIRKTNMIFDRPVNKSTGFNDLKEYQYLTLPPYGAGKYYYIIFHDGKGRQKYGIWDSAENILMTNDRTEGKTMGQIIGSYGNNMIGLIRSKELYDELVGHGFPRASVYIEHLLENDDYALIIYHLK